MKINYIQVGITVYYEPTEINDVFISTKEYKDFFVDEEKYNKILELLKSEL